MKNILKYTLALFTGFLMYSCYDGIDPITAVDPGPDMGAPVILLNSPTDGTTIDALEMNSTIEVDFKVEDDIEIDVITVSLDGEVINQYDSFTDYRIFSDAFDQSGIDFGNHILTVTATDMEGNETEVSATISKPVYTPLFANEVFYMPFDADFGEYVSVSEAGTVGSPTLTDDKFLGNNAFQSAADSYLTFPMEDMLGSNFTGMFWYKVVSSPDRAGILTIGDDAADRNQGFRLFREGSSSSQTVKLNVGVGTGESWNNGGSISVNNGDWINIAFTVSPDETVVYFNGAAMNTGTPTGPVDWTGCVDMVIGAGGPTFDYWGHASDASPMDELRFFNATLSQEEIQNVINVTNPYEPTIEGEVFYMPFEGNYMELLSQDEVGIVGAPGFAGQSQVGIDAYAGAADSYLTFPAADLELGGEFSAAFWYKLNDDPNRAGILTLRPPMDGTANDLTKGFCFFREAAGDMQRFKLNAGNGGSGVWFDGGSDADVDPTVNEWIHLAFTISGSECVVYINGEVVKQGSFGGVDWTDCTSLSIMSGAPNFIGWNHFSDLSYMDELKLFNRALSQEEIQSML
ncbi:LamG domain-containing protein [Mangrovimonas sp. ST2L15]|uniref:LamG domain-containing protein n=1 Tax=Mangrovimonas sp. ST2L15 TaxID=1645916 RepID=UPI0009EA4506|nr:LamG domain-containing protein [Mangrovimonas sp. ST2L15]